jgi:glycosyltransferase involved in cell wall biosynthesis
MVAILMATYNGGRYLREQLDSIVGQTCRDWELFIRDDGSSDDTLEIIDEYASRNKNIHLITDNLGSLRTRDQFLHLLKIVDADYYMFCDQDDKWHLDKVEKSLDKIREVEANNPGRPVLIGSDCHMCGSNLEVVNKSCWDHLRIEPRKFLNKNGIFVYPFITGASMILNKAARNIIPPIPEGMPKNRPMYDWWVLIQVFKYGVVELIEEPTRFYRQHSNNVSGGLDKLDTSYWHKLERLKRIWEANRMRLKVLEVMGYTPAFKYWFYKTVFLCKMLAYKHKS